MAGIALAVACGYGEIANAAPKVNVLFSFDNLRGVEPDGGLLADSAGNLYGMAFYGGANNDGVVFELTPPTVQGKHWTETVLHSFNGTDGNNPYGAGGLVMDGTGNLYGTTTNGGANKDGVVFKLTPPAEGQTAWTETVLQSFSGRNGMSPEAGLIGDGAGNLYGTTRYGGAHGDGLVFKLTPPAEGQTAWIETVLHSFNLFDGRYPYVGLLADAFGNFYGATANGGLNDDGVVFELTPPAEGQTAWRETVLFSFNGTDGFNPYGGLTADGAGNLYGTTQQGGANNDGVVFKLTPPAVGGKHWTETVLHSFNGTDGQYPHAGLIADAAGNYYGTTTSGGGSTYCTGGCGVVFEVTPPAPGETAWTERVLHSFKGIKGNDPLAGLIADSAGAFYGTTQWGGLNGDGSAFKITP